MTHRGNANGTSRNERTGTAELQLSLRLAMPAGAEECLAVPASQPFVDDADYLRTIGVLIRLNRKVRKLSARIDEVSGNIDVASRDLARGDHVRHEVGERARTLAALVLSRLSAQPEERRLPRVERVGRRLGLSELERRALAMMLVSELTNFYQDDLLIKQEDDLQRIALASGMSMVELMAFVDPARPHMKQELFELDKGSSISMLHASYEMPDVMVKALSGGTVTAEELLKVEHTAVAEALREDGAITGGVPSARAEEGAEENAEKLPDLDLDASVTGEENGDASDEEPAPETATLDSLAPYRSDREYLEDRFEYLCTRIKRYTAERKNTTVDPLSSGRSPESILRELRGRERLLERRYEARMELTRAAGRWLPRLERLRVQRNLGRFEMNILLMLVGLRIAPDAVVLDSSAFSYRATFEVQDLLGIWADNVSERVECRRYFYRNSTLLREGIIRLGDGYMNSLERCDVYLDRRMLDWIVGLDIEASEMVEGSHLYVPRVDVNHVVLPPEQRKLILDTVRSYDLYREVRRELGFEEIIRYGRSTVMLFHGPPGTGKTMMANALAAHLGKKVFLVNWPTLGGMEADLLMKAIFREARLHDALLFFDECDGIFETREKANKDITTLLSEIEQHDGLVVMATNRPFDLDEAMHRRITLAIEFRQPDPHLREEIWRKHVPPAVRLEPGVDFHALAMQFELTGGFIRNAVLTALSLAVAREGRDPCIRHADLVEGARLQLRSRLKMAELDRRVVPGHGLDAVVVPGGVRQNLDEIVRFEKARSVLFGQWGFAAQSYGHGTAALFHGAPGTGKTFAAEAVGFEIGRTLKVVNVAQVLSAWVGESAKNIEALFDDARQSHSVLVFDEADGLLANRTSVTHASDRYANADVGLLLYHIERFPGVVILTTNMIENLDSAVLRRLRFVLEFPWPDATQRRALWRSLLPAATPVASCVDLDLLGDRYGLSGAGIRNAIFRAAARAALRPEASRRLTMADLVAAAEEEAPLSRKGTVGFRTA